jgi:hypothetical protein
VGGSNVFRWNSCRLHVVGHELSAMV